MPARVVALCGLDGVGKTTLFRMLEERLDSGRFAFVPRGPADCERLVEAYVPRTFHDHRDWLTGLFSNAVAIACAMDFRRYYDTCIVPLLKAPEHEVVITDRYAVCFRAYTNCTDAPDPIATAILDSVPLPDLVIHVTLEPDLIRERQSRRADGTNEFEHPEAQERLLHAYERFFRDSGCPVVQIANDGTTKETFARAVERITEWDGHRRV